MLLNFLLEGGGEELEEQVLLASVGAIVEELQDDSLDKSRAIGGRQRAQQLGQVDGPRLHEIEQVLIELDLVVALLAQLADVLRLAELDVLVVLLHLLVLHEHVLDGEAVLDEQADLDVHHVELLLEQLVLLDERDDVALVLVQRELVAQRGAVVLEQVHELAHDTQRRILVLHQRVVVEAGATRAHKRLDLHRRALVLAQVGATTHVLATRQPHAHIRLNGDHGSLVSDKVLQSPHVHSSGTNHSVPSLQYNQTKQNII